MCICVYLIIYVGEGKATHSSLHAWKIPKMEEPAGVLQDMTEQFHFTSVTFVCIYVYPCDICVCVCVCIYIYIYI